MKQVEYKFERFLQPQFPIYTSVQFGRKVLAQIHYHVSAEIIKVLEGKVQILIGNTYIECQKGDIIFIPPSVVHEVTSLTEDSDAAIKGITFEYSLIKVKSIDLDLLELFHRRQGLQYVVTCEEEGYEKLCGCINNISVLYGDFSTVNKIQIVSYLLLIVSQLIRNFSLQESVQDKNYLKLKPVLTYVMNHYKEKIRISQLSKIIHVCDDRLIRLFKEVTGETPIEYVINIRVEAGIKLLASTDLSIAEIADQTGFGSQTYMTRVFKEKLDKTPGKYRNK